MKQRRIYYRKKNKSIIIEGREKGKSIYIMTLPDPLKLIDALRPENMTQKDLTKAPLSKHKRASLLTKEKYQKIMQNVARLDYKSKQGEKQA